MALTKSKSSTRTKSPPSKKTTSSRGRKKVVKVDPEMIEVAEVFRDEFELRTREVDRMVEEFQASALASMLQDLEEVAATCDLDMPLVDFIATMKAGRRPPAPAQPVPRPRATAAVVKQETEEEEQAAVLPLAAARTPIQAVVPEAMPATPEGRVDAVLPGGAHMRVPAMIRPKIGNDALLNVRILKPNEIAFSMNGTPLQLPRSIADKSVNDVVTRQQSIGANQEPIPMEYNDCD